MPTTTKKNIKAKYNDAFKGFSTEQQSEVYKYLSPDKSLFSTLSPFAGVLGYEKTDFSDFSGSIAFSEGLKQISGQNDIYAVSNMTPITQINEKTISHHRLTGQLFEGYKLKRPQIIKIVFDGNEYIGSIDELELYAFGDSEEEVIEEINEEIIELYNFLNSEEKLGTNPKQWKKYINSLIEATECH